MSSVMQALTPETILEEMGLDTANLARRLDFVGYTPEDARRVVVLKDLMEANVQALTSQFFDFLSHLPEAKALLARPDLMAQARLLKAAHLRAMVTGDYDRDYAVQRLKLGLIYASVGLDARVFLGAFHNLLLSLGGIIMQHSVQAPLEGFKNFMALKKVAFFDISLILDVLVFERERIIRQQQHAIFELSTPVLQVREKLLLLPLIGLIDTERAKQVTDGLLRQIRATRARVAILDLTGVAVMDSKVANHLLQTAASARLMGAKVIVTGLSSELARSLVGLGIELGELETTSSLLAGFEAAERELRMVKPAILEHAEDVDP
jgi:rsbT co-antagonist protein RsbR